jgi:hypothetical protein
LAGMPRASLATGRTVAMVWPSMVLILLFS